MTGPENRSLETASIPKKLNPIEGRLGIEVGEIEADLRQPEDLYQAGLLFQFKKEFEQALQQFEAAYKLFIERKSFLGAVLCLVELAWLKYNHSESDGSVKANRLFSEAHEMIQAHIHEAGISEAKARLLHYKGLIKCREKQFGVGLKYFKLAKSFCRPHGLEAAKIQDSLAIHYEQTGDFHRAVRSLQSALAIKERINIPHEQAITTQILGRLYSVYEEYSMALAYLQQSLVLSETLGDVKRVTSLKNELIRISICQGEFETAQGLIQQAEAENQQKQLVVPAAMTELYKCYLLFFSQSKNEQAIDTCYAQLQEHVLPILKRHGFHKGYGLALRLNACLEQQFGRHLQALESMGEAIAIFKEAKLVDELAKTYFELGKLYWEREEKKLALASMLDALKIAEQNGLGFLTSYIEDEIFRIDEAKWQEIVEKRANHERVFEKEHTLLDALSALATEDNGSGENEQTKSLISLLKVGQAMAGERDLDKLLRLIKDETERALDADRCTVFLYDRDSNELWSKVASGLEGTEEIRFPAHLGLAGYVAKTGETLNIKQAYEDPRFNKEVDKKTGYKTENLLCMPMRNRKMEIIGVFQVLNKRNTHFEKVDEDLLMAISASAGVAIENAQLATEQKLAFESFIKTLSSTIDARDPITAGHSERVAEYSLLIGEQLHFSGEEMEVLKYASLLHDIGKIGIKEEILVKEGRLTLNEYRHIQKHVFYTHEILKNIYFERHLQKVPEVAASHHEKVDGSGYFRNLKGTEIPLSGRILAVSDVFDAITSRRQYRNRMPFDKVLTVLKRDAGSHFDSDCVDTFFNVSLHRLGHILLMDQSLDLPESSFSLLREIDRDITIREYEDILKKEKMSKGEADIHRAFTALYHHTPISHLD